METPRTRLSKYWCSVPRCLSDNRNGTGLSVSMYTTESQIDMQRVNVPQLKEFLAFSVKDRYQLKKKLYL
jgi:hypothetical protein